MKKIKAIFKKFKKVNPAASGSKKGMELVQIAIIIGIAVGLGIIFKDQITEFVNNTFETLLGTDFD